MSSGLKAENALQLEPPAVETTMLLSSDVHLMKDNILEFANGTHQHDDDTKRCCHICKKMFTSETTFHMHLSVTHNIDVHDSQGIHKNERNNTQLRSNSGGCSTGSINGSPTGTTNGCSTGIINGSSTNIINDGVTGTINGSITGIINDNTSIKHMISFADCINVPNVVVKSESLCIYTSSTHPSIHTSSTHNTIHTSAHSSIHTSSAQSSIHTTSAHTSIHTTSAHPSIQSEMKMKINQVPLLTPDYTNFPSMVFKSTEQFHSSQVKHLQEGPLVGSSFPNTSINSVHTSDYNTSNNYKTSHYQKSTKSRKQIKMCNICKKTFTRNTNLRRHLENNVCKAKVSCDNKGDGHDPKMFVAGVDNMFEFSESSAVSMYKKGKQIPTVVNYNAMSSTVVHKKEMPSIVINNNVMPSMLINNNVMLSTSTNNNVMSSRLKNNNVMSSKVIDNNAISSKLIDNKAMSPKVIDNNAMSSTVINNNTMSTLINNIVMSSTILNNNDMFPITYNNSAYIPTMLPSCCANIQSPRINDISCFRTDDIHVVSSGYVSTLPTVNDDVDTVLPSDYTDILSTVNDDVDSIPTVLPSDYTDILSTVSNDVDNIPTVLPSDYADSSNILTVLPSDCYDVQSTLITSEVNPMPTARLKNIKHLCGSKIVYCTNAISPQNVPSSAHSVPSSDQPAVCYYNKDKRHGNMKISSRVDCLLNNVVNKYRCNASHGTTRTEEDVKHQTSFTQTTNLLNHLARQEGKQFGNKLENTVLFSTYESKSAENSPSISFKDDTISNSTISLDQGNCLSVSSETASCIPIVFPSDFVPSTTMDGNVGNNNIIKYDYNRLASMQSDNILEQPDELAPSIDVESNAPSHANVSPIDAPVDGNIVASSKVLSCNICRKTFTRVQNLQRHLMIHKNKENYNYNKILHTYQKKNEKDVNILNINVDSKGVILQQAHHDFSAAICNNYFDPPEANSTTPLFSIGDAPMHVHNLNAIGSLSTNYTSRKRLTRTCHVCKKVFSRTTTLRRHMIVHQRNVKCDKCNKSYHKDKFVAHLAWCIQRFDNKVLHYKNNMPDHTLNDRNSNTACGTDHLEQKKIVPEQIDVIGLSQDIEASNCSNTLDSSAGVICTKAPKACRRHKLTKTCHICKKVFSRTTTLKRHLIIHQKKGMYKCDNCDVSYVRKDEFDVHLLNCNGSSGSSASFSNISNSGNLLEVTSMTDGVINSLVEPDIASSFCNIELSNFSSHAKFQAKFQAVPPDHVEGIVTSSSQAPSEIKNENNVKLFASEVRNSNSTTRQLQSNPSDVITPTHHLSVQVNKEIDIKSTPLPNFNNFAVSQPLHITTGSTIASRKHLNRSITKEQKSRGRRRLSRTCDICKKLFSRTDALKRHLVIHQNKPIFRCETCKRAFHRETNYITHVSLCNVFPLTSGEQKKTHTKTNINSSLYKHISSNKSSDVYLLSNNTPSDFNYDKVLGPSMPHPPSADSIATSMPHFMPQNGAVKIQRMCGRPKLTKTCHICKKTFSRTTVLRNHMLIHQNKPIFKCAKCGKCYHGKSRYTSHILKCTAVTNTCNDGSLNESLHGNDDNKKNAANLSTYENMFQDAYENMFQDASDVISSLQPPPPLPFDNGTSDAADKGLVKTRKMCGRPKLTRTCHICKKTFSRTTVLRKHILTHQNKVGYKCEKCKLPFRKESHLSTHMITCKQRNNNSVGSLSGDTTMTPLINDVIKHTVLRCPDIPSMVVSDDIPSMVVSDGIQSLRDDVMYVKTEEDSHSYSDTNDLQYTLGNDDVKLEDMYGNHDIDEKTFGLLSRENNLLSNSNVTSIQSAIPLQPPNELDYAPDHDSVEDEDKEENGCLLSKQSEDIILSNSNPVLNPVTSIQEYVGSIKVKRSCGRPKLSRTCHVCNKTFSRTTVLRKHMVIHQTKSIYKCETCQISFRRKNHFTAHMLKCRLLNNESNLTESNASLTETVCDYKNLSLENNGNVRNNTPSDYKTLSANVTTSPISDDIGGSISDNIVGSNFSRITSSHCNTSTNNTTFLSSTYFDSTSINTIVKTENILIDTKNENDTHTIHTQSFLKSNDNMEQSKRLLENDSRTQYKCKRCDVCYETKDKLDIHVALCIGNVVQTSFSHGGHVSMALNNSHMAYDLKHYHNNITADTPDVQKRILSANDSNVINNGNLDNNDEIKSFKMSFKNMFPHRQFGS